MRSKEEYLEWEKEHRLEIIDSRKQENRPLYHFSPPIGWLNDPNGLFEKDGIYHIYYQYSPDNINGGRKIWGHTTSVDFLTYVDHEPLLFADCKWDTDGVYSGSAYVQKGEISFYYTGNVRHTDKEYDYINFGREQNTICIKSRDGFILQEKQRMLTNEDYPKNMSNHVRDPKIIMIDNKKCMILGARSKDSVGCALVYQEMKNNQWKYWMSIKSEKPFGYMWECPDIVTLDNKMFLITCPQGINKEKQRYLNAHQNGYFPISFGLDKKEYQVLDFEILDYGFDFYAPQTFEDTKKRVILIAWMAVPEAKYSSKEEGSTWNHVLTIPRVLTQKNGKILQNPVNELKKMRYAKEKVMVEKAYSYENQTQCFESIFSFEKKTSFCIKIRTNVYLKYENGIFILDMKNGNCGRKERFAKIEVVTNIRVYSDISSLEIFINEGEYVFSTRVFEKEISAIDIDVDRGKLELEYYELKK